MKVRMYKLIQEIVDSGIESGYQYACKHTENPHPDTIKHCIERYIMQGFDEYFGLDTESSVSSQPYQPVPKEVEELLSTDEGQKQWLAEWEAKEEFDKEMKETEWWKQHIENLERVNKEEKEILDFVKENLTIAKGMTGHIEIKGVHCSIRGDVGGDVNGDVGGNVGGNVCGNVDGDVGGDVVGDVHGNVNGDVRGDVDGNVGGNVCGNVDGHVGGNVYGCDV